MTATSTLRAVMYHYVRDLPRTPYPKLKATPLDRFRRQVDELREHFEMATLESALAFLDGNYKPSRDLCLLTFDDGLKEHAVEVAPLLAERGIQGLFFIITGCQENNTVASVHMNHFLMASLDFERYRREFQCLAGDTPEVDSRLARAAYPWDTPEMADFKYLFNFLLEAPLRDRVVRDLFAAHIGPEDAFSRELYLSWTDACAMQSAGMVIGGHSHTHRPLSALPPLTLRAELETCRELLDTRLGPYPARPFCFPYGKNTSFHAGAVGELRRLGFSCGFTTEAGANPAGTGRFAIRRIDWKNAEGRPLRTAA